MPDRGIVGPHFGRRAQSLKSAGWWLSVSISSVISSMAASRLLGSPRLSVTPQRAFRVPPSRLGEELPITPVGRGAMVAPHLNCEMCRAGLAPIWDRSMFSWRAVCSAHGWKPCGRKSFVLDRSHKVVDHGLNACDDRPEGLGRREVGIPVLLLNEEFHALL